MYSEIATVTNIYRTNVYINVYTNVGSPAVEIPLISFDTAVFSACTDGLYRYYKLQVTGRETCHRRERELAFTAVSIVTRSELCIAKYCARRFPGVCMHIHTIFPAQRRATCWIPERSIIIETHSKAIPGPNSPFCANAEESSHLGNKVKRKGK